MALRGFANTARSMVETDRVGYVWSVRRDGKPDADNLRYVVRGILLTTDPLYHPVEWARIIDTRDGGEVCRIAIDDSCQPTEAARRLYGRLKEGR